MSACVQHGLEATHQSIKAQQDVALPRRPRLSFGPALRVDRVSKQEEGLVRPPLLVLCHGVQAGEGIGGGSKPPSEVCGAVVDDEGRVGRPMLVVRLRRRVWCWESTRGKIRDLNVEVHGEEAGIGALRGLSRV
jgi:hypothetical protein